MHLCLALSVAGSSWVFADVASDSAKAASVMKKASDFYSKASNLAILFKAHMYWSATEEWNDAEGTLWLSGQNRFHVFLPELELVSNGKTLWKYSKSNKQVSLENFGDNRGNRHPSQILFEFLKCKPLRMVLKKEGKEEFHKIFLEPGAGLRHYDSLQVLIRKKNGAPYQVKTLDAAENISIYTISSIKSNTVFKEKDFFFKTPKGVEEIDMRQ